jgi:hypothetical protein
MRSVRAPHPPQDCSPKSTGWLKRGVVLVTVKVWPINVGANLEVGATANLDGACARRHRAAMPERTIARCAASRHLTEITDSQLGNKLG